MKAEKDHTLDWAIETLNKLTSEIEQFQSNNEDPNITKLKGLASDVISTEIQRLRVEIINDFYGSETEYGIADVINTVCAYYNVTPDILELKSRKREVIEPRQLLHWMLRSQVVNNRMSLEAIGQLTGGQDHATVRHSFVLVRDRIKTERLFREDVMALCNKLGARTFWNGNDLEISRRETESA